MNNRLYTKSIGFEDINYQLAQNEDKTAIFENWCDFLNYFDSSIFVQLSFINQKASLNEFRKRINIPAQEDAFNDIRSEYSGMLQSQLTKGNNGLVKRKYITFGIEADSLRTAKPKLERIETDILNNFKTLGVRTEPLSGYERLKVLHDEPIVDEETWLLAQKLRQNVRKADPMGEPNVLTGKIYCADCGAPMYNHRQRKGRERIYYTAKGEKRTSHSNPADCYECSTYNLGCQRYDRHCTCHHISTKALKSIILKTIQETCHYVSLNEREFVYSLQEESAMKDIAVSETVKNRIERNQKRVHELDMLIRKIYEDNVIGRLPDRLFQSMLTDYENEQNELNKIIETDTADMQRIIGGQNNVERFLKLVKKYENITELTPAMINEFIDKILIHEPQGKGADRTTEVEIYLNYVGQFQVPVEQHEPTEEERIAAEKEAERLRRKRESNRKYMKKIREKSKEFAEHERIAEEKSSDSNVCVEQNATSKSNRQKVKGEKIA